MRSLTEIERELELIVNHSVEADAETLLHIGEEVLENWIRAKDLDPTDDRQEGFRLLALQRQGARGEPSFNACRETCRELVYHYNLVSSGGEDQAAVKSYLEMMALVANHLCLFVSGKMQVAELGEFCCSSKPLRDATNEVAEINDA